MKKSDIVTTASGKPAHVEFDIPESPAPQPIDPVTKQHGDHWVLKPEERAKGLVRPVRCSYKHVGERPQYPTRPLTPEQQQAQAGCGYVAYEPYPEGQHVLSQFWTEAQLHSGCGAITTMGSAIAETYARNPKFYGRTFCCVCKAYLPVAEFVWVDAFGRHTDERVGS